MKKKITPIDVLFRENDISAWKEYGIKKGYWKYFNKEIKLPEDKNICPCDYCCGWDDCIREVKKLNGIQ